MRKLLLVTAATMTNLLTGCVTEPVVQEDCFYNCEYPAPAMIEEESAISRQNRINANRYRERKMKEYGGITPSWRRHHNDALLPESQYHGQVPEYQPSPREQTWPAVEITIPRNEAIIIETQKQ